MAAPPSDDAGFRGAATDGHPYIKAMPTQETLLIKYTDVEGARLYELPVIQDSRGSLSFAQYEDTLPFLPKRYFIVFGVGEGQTRGGHAHRTVHQLLTCVKGSCIVTFNDGKTHHDVSLDRPELALYLPPRIWATQHDFSREAVLMVLASDVYNPDEYIKDYDEFLSLSES
ncbi:MAG TPA: FdtA/QdtA family cupin domain-containing protein [Blastocatellia bacterium]|nr:FdtA/QdtA family cupin domain-containing protein [Blastocatellia bacterium]